MCIAAALDVAAIGFETCLRCMRVLRVGVEVSPVGAALGPRSRSMACIVENPA